MNRSQESETAGGGGGQSMPGVVVVGAGPAGILAAMAAAQQGATVTLCEKLARPGLKLMATGGGHCNLSNTLPEAEFMARFGRHGRFMQPALATLGQDSLREFLATVGIPTVSPDGFKVFPEDQSAVHVQQKLLAACRRLGVMLRTTFRVDRLLVAEGCVRGIEGDGQTVPAAAVILATGGVGYPELGGGDDGLRLARSVGHRIEEPVPALVAMKVADAWVGSLAGVTLEEARLWIEEPTRHPVESSGSLLFTHEGVSGPAALDLSGEVSRRLRKHSPVLLCLNPVSRMSREEWERTFSAWRTEHGSKRLSRLLDWHLPASLAELACQENELAVELSASRLSKTQADRMSRWLTAIPLHVSGTEGFGRAMVTKGGVCLKEIDPATLQSRLVKRLFFCGELVDLDGPTGGFNLQWAFSSGHLAGQRAAQMVG